MRYLPQFQSLSPVQLLRIARREIGAVAIVLVGTLCLLGFLAIQDEMREGETAAFDQAILLALRVPGDTAQPIGPLWLQIAMTDLTSLGGITVLALMTLSVLGYLILAGKHSAALLLAVAVGGGVLLELALKSGFDRPRPDLVAHIVRVSTPSFPSGHAMQSAIVYLTLGVLLTRLEARRRIKLYIMCIAILLTLSIGLSRIYLGVHWPTDVLGGWSVGAAWAILCWAVALWLQRRGQIDPPAPGSGSGTEQPPG